MEKPEWQLAGIGPEGTPWLVTISTNPFMVGRRNDCNLCLSDDGISRHHAELRLESGLLYLCDSGSTNGTYVNSRRLREKEACPLSPGDRVHFAGIEFKVLQRDLEDELTDRRDPYVDKFREMLDTRAVVPHYQPMVKLSDGKTVVGYELLGRTNYLGLPEMPEFIFPIARNLGEDEVLSALFRDEGVKQVVRNGYRGTLFFNTLPLELFRQRFLKDLLALLQSAPGVHLGLEVNEHTATNVKAIQSLRDFLDEHKMKLSYDDFGAGQSRLIEIIKTPPDFLKFDRVLISNIDRIPAQASMVKGLVAMCREAGITTVAEGVEVSAEAESCREIGFDLAQGFYFGRPSPEPPGKA